MGGDAKMRHPLTKLVCLSFSSQWGHYIGTPILMSSVFIGVKYKEKTPHFGVFFRD